MKSAQKRAPRIAKKTFDCIGRDAFPVGVYCGPCRTPKVERSDVSLPDYSDDRVYRLLKDAGINFIIRTDDSLPKRPDAVSDALEKCEKYGLGYLISDSEFTRLTEASATEKIIVPEYLKQFALHKNCIGVELVDEPSANRFRRLSAASRALKREFPGLVYINLLPKGLYGPAHGLFGYQYSGNGERPMRYEEYLSKFLETVRPEILSFDVYPFFRAGQGISEMKQFLANVSDIRRFAEIYGIPFWAFVQCGGQWNDEQKELVSQAVYPSREEFLWSVNIYLTYGAKAIQYFPFIQPWYYAKVSQTEMDYGRSGMIGADGRYNPWYFYAAEINAFLAESGHILLNSASKGIIAHGEFAKRLAGGEYGMLFDGVYRELRRIEGSDCLIGCFDCLGKSAFYITNMSVSEKACVRLKFDGDHSFVLYGMQGARELSGDGLAVTIDKGEGILVLLK